MGRHQIRNQILLLPDPAVHLFKLLCKFFVYPVFRLSHEGQYRSSHMFRRDFQLPADMILAQLSEKILFLICQKVIKTNARTYENLLNFRNLPQLFQQLYIIGVVCIQIAARRGGKGTAGSGIRRVPSVSYRTDV